MLKQVRSNLSSGYLLNLDFDKGPSLDSYQGFPYPYDKNEGTMARDPKLDKLKTEIAKAKQGSGAEAPLNPLGQNKSLNNLGKFFNVGVELISGVFVGVGCGLFIDWAFGTSPWGLISLFILGSAAGLLNVYRALTVKNKTDTQKDTHV